MKVPLDVLAVLSALEFPSTNQARIADQLDRAMYEKVNKALVAIGGKWDRRAKAHVFVGDASSLIDLAITTGEVQTHNDVGHFPTPAKLAKDLVAMAKVQSGHRVLEPSAGTGRIVDAALAIEGVHVFAVERDVARRKHLSERSEAMGHAGRLHVGECDDFMAYPATGGFDRVVMNPPFCRVGAGDHIDHVQKALSLLNHGGVMVSVLPASIEFRRDRRHTGFRDWCLERGEISSLPDGSFKESGTDVNAVIVRLVRS